MLALLFVLLITGQASAQLYDPYDPYAYRQPGYVQPGQGYPETRQYLPPSIPQYHVPQQHPPSQYNPYNGAPYEPMPLVQPQPHNRQTICNTQRMGNSSTTMCY